jgi:hypothetical protein
VPPGWLTSTSINRTDLETLKAAIGDCYKSPSPPRGPCTAQGPPRHAEQFTTPRSYSATPATTLRRASDNSQDPERRGEETAATDHTVPRAVSQIGLMRHSSRNSLAILQTLCGSNWRMRTTCETHQDKKVHKDPKVNPVWQSASSFDRLQTNDIGFFWSDIP